MLLADGVADVAVIAEVTTTQESGHGIDEVEVVVMQVDVDDFHSRHGNFRGPRDNDIVVILADDLKMHIKFGVKHGKYLYKVSNSYLEIKGGLRTRDSRKKFKHTLKWGKKQLNHANNLQ